MKKKLQRILLSEDGDASYISTFVYILVVVILMAFIINVFRIISVKQVQLNGKTSGDADSLFHFLAAQLSDVESLDYQVTSLRNTSKIQIVTLFYVTVTGHCHLGSFWKFNLVSINIRAQGAASANTTGSKETLCDVTY